MFDFLLEAANIRQIPHETISEKLAVGTEVTLRGMGTVFAVLILIWGLVEFLHLLLGVKTPKNVKVEVPAVTEVAEAPAKAEEPAPQDDLALIAVITAAIAAASGSSPNSFRVVSFKRANNKFSQGR